MDIFKVWVPPREHLRVQALYDAAIAFYWKMSELQNSTHLFLKHQNQVHLFFKHENQACLFLAVGHQDLFTSVLGSGAIKFEKSEERLQHLEAHKFLELFELLPDPIRKPNDPLEPLDLDLETLDLLELKEPLGLSPLYCLESLFNIFCWFLCLSNVLMSTFNLPSRTFRSSKSFCSLLLNFTLLFSCSSFSLAKFLENAAF